MADEVLRAERVTKRFGGFVAVDGVTIGLRRGERVGLIGPNGAGKTTLLNLLSGYYRPDSGRIFVNGIDVTKHPPHRRFKLGLCRTFQIPSVFRSLTVRQNLEVAALRSGVRDRTERIESLLVRLGLDRYGNEKAGNLPYGAMKVLELAMVLTSEPSVLLLDEPTAGLNVTEKKRLTEILESLPENITLLIIEHDMDVVFNLAGRVIVMNRGQVIADGKPSEVVENKLVREVYFG